MKSHMIRNTGLFLLAAIFGAGLMFAFTELPRLADTWVQSHVSTPQTDPAWDGARIELFYEAYAVRLIGYTCLGLIVLCIVIGFTTRKTGWAAAGGIALFLPVFATFAHSMFFLAGLGLFNIILFPFLDISLALADLGKIVLVPYWILLWFFGLFHWHARAFITYVCMISGALIFVLGVFAWMRTRYSTEKVARNWIYRYSRHPQYLGWIIWSYGLMLYGPTINEMKKSWGWNGTLPWLLSTMVIIGICLIEEMRMKEKVGDSYESYRKQTPFMFPMPKFIRVILKAPARLILRKDRPEKRSEAGFVILGYTVLLIGLSLFWVDWAPEKRSMTAEIRPYSAECMDSLVTEIRKPQPRRSRTSEPFNELLCMGKEAYPALFELMQDNDPVVREFALQAACDGRVREAVPAMIQSLNDSVPRVVITAIRGLAEFRAKEAEAPLLDFLEHPRDGIRQHHVLNALVQMKCTCIKPWLEKQLEDSLWFNHTGALRSMTELDMEYAKPFIYASLNHSDPLVRRGAVNLLLETLPEDAVPHLETVLKDDDWEVRFYAGQAIRLIREKAGKDPG
ncbi:HEAT repeat domain-containing protein [bacterium]|nr:HEAT repeat domain-containing protein [bacterium]